MAGTVPPTPSRATVAVVLLSLLWLVYGALLAVILAVEPIVVPLWIYVAGVVPTLAFCGGLLASRRWDAVWQRTFLPTVGLPSWLWIGGVATAVAVALVASVGSISFEGAFWIGVLCSAFSFSVGGSTQLEWLSRFVPWPSWVVVTVAAALGVVILVSVVVGTAPLLTVVYLVALLLFTFHVCFILPLAVYQFVREGEHGGLDSYPSVSVLIPAFDEEGYVGDCIESVLASTYPGERLEVVVVDDGSGDGTFAEAAAYREAGVKVFRRENGGKHAALNMGLQCSSGEVVVTIDADSRPEPTAIEEMVGELRSDPAIGGLSAAVVATNHDTLLTGLQRIEYAISNTNRRAYSIFDAVPVVPGCLGVYRREALEGVWGYDPDTLTEDFDLTVKLLKDGWLVRHGTGAVRTVVPEDWRTLWRQRLRWYCGGIETIQKHRDVLLSPEYRYLHALSLPARLVSHLFGPVGSFVILGAVAWGFLTGPSPYLLALVVLFFLLTTLVTLLSIVVEGEPASELVYAPLLFVGYKHFVDCSIGVGTVRAFLGTGRW